MSEWTVSEGDARIDRAEASKVTHFLMWILEQWLRFRFDCYCAAFDVMDRE